MKLSGPFFRVNRSLSRAFLSAGLGVFALLGCSDGAGPTAIEIPIVLIEVTQPCSSVIEGQSCVIGVRAFAEGGQQIANPVLRYLTTNSSVADVTTSGTVRGIAPGDATIYVTNSTASVQDEFRVFVFPLSVGRP
jgi:hypothetical protein